MQPNPGLQVLLPIVGAALAFRIGGRTIFRAVTAKLARLPADPHRPVRWHLALPVKTRMRGKAHGTARPLDDLLTAPLTRRPCIAYELGVLTNHDGATEGATWLLREQRSAAFAVDTMTFPSNAVRLQLQPEVVDPRAIAADRLRAVLQERAFVSMTTDLLLVETIIETGDVLTIRDATAPFGDSSWHLPTVTKTMRGCAERTA